MGTTYDQVLSTIYDAIVEVNETLDPAKVLAQAPETVLFGESGALDSVALVNLAVTVEADVERKFNARVSVMDAITVDATREWTAGELALWIAERVEQTGAPV